MSSVALAAQRQRRGEVDGGRGLADAAFLVGDGDDHRNGGGPGIVRHAGRGGEVDRSRRLDACTASRLHLVLAEIVRVEALQPLVQPVGVGLLRR